MFVHFVVVPDVVHIAQMHRVVRSGVEHVFRDGFRFFVPVPQPPAILILIAPVSSAGDAAGLWAIKKMQVSPCA